MTQAEAIAAIRTIVTEYRAKPQEFLSGRVILVVSRKGGRPPRGEHMRILPGVLGRVVGVNADGRYLVDVEVAKLERWLAAAETGGRP